MHHASCIKDWYMLDMLSSHASRQNQGMHVGFMLGLTLWVRPTWVRPTRYGSKTFSCHGIFLNYYVSHQWHRAESQLHEIITWHRTKQVTNWSYQNGKSVLSDGCVLLPSYKPTESSRPRPCNKQSLYHQGRSDIQNSCMHLYVPGKETHTHNLCWTWFNTHFLCLDPASVAAFLLLRLRMATRATARAMTAAPPSVHQSKKASCNRWCLFPEGRSSPKTRNPYQLLLLKAFCCLRLA